MKHTLANLRVEYEVPLWVREAILDHLQREVTLSNLPEEAGWTFVTRERGVLTINDMAVVVNVYGAVHSCQLRGFLSDVPPNIEVRLWSVEDGARASELFTKCNPNDPCVAAEVLYPQQKQTDVTPEEARGDCPAVFDGTNASYGREAPVLHPSSVKKGDVVRLRCNLVLEAKVGVAPCYKLHVESVIVVALCPAQIPLFTV